MRIGIRLAISGLVLASIMVSAIGVHVLWWRTAEANSHALAATINEQIVSAVEKELTAITTQARAAHTAIRIYFFKMSLKPCRLNRSMQPQVLNLAAGVSNSKVLRGRSFS
jgi:adenylate cyclase